MTLEPGVIPPLPPARGYETTATGSVRPRYEDVTQDGRVQLTSLVSGLSTIWRTFDQTAVALLMSQGIIPIMQRLVIEGAPGPFSVSHPIEVSSTWRLARETSGDRLFLDMWLDAHAPHGSTFAPPPTTDASSARVGRVYVSHVFTRPFAAANERRVTRLDAPGIPPIPEDEHESAEAASLAAAATPLELIGDVVFGMMHTDSNHHVNSLVYPRTFEGAVIRRGDPVKPTHLARTIELRYRKPFFAGERAQMWATAAAATSDGSVVTFGAFGPADASVASAVAKPNAAIAMWLA